MCVRNVKSSDGYPKPKAILAVVETIINLSTGEKEECFDSLELVMIPKSCLHTGEQLVIHSLKGKEHHMITDEAIIEINQVNEYVTVKTALHEMNFKKKFG